MSAEVFSLSESDKALLNMERMTREVRIRVRTALHGSGVHPVSMDFGLSHPILNALGLGHDGSYRLILALNKGDTLNEERLTAIDKSLLEWAEVKVQPTITRRARWNDKINGFIQHHGTAGNL